MSEYFPEPKSLGERVKVELELSNYATKADLKNATGADTSKFAKRVYLTSLKSEIDKLYIGRLETTLVDLSKLSDLVKNEAIKKTVYYDLAKKVDAIQASDTAI